MRPIIADLHMHTIMSGHAFGTIREMAAQAAERKLLMIGITEHAPGIPGTCNPIYFRNLEDAPRQLFGVQILYGSEVNVLSGGRLSLDRRHLDCLDYGIVGIHGLCYENAGCVKNTDAVLKCMEDPKIRIVSHPDDSRYPMDYPALVQGAKELGVALEVNNSSLRRPDMRPGCVQNYEQMLSACAANGVQVVVNSDAHDPLFVGDMRAAQTLLSQLHFPEELILNRDIHVLRAFLKV